MPKSQYQNGSGTPPFRVAPVSRRNVKRTTAVPIPPRTHEEEGGEKLFPPSSRRMIAHPAIIMRMEITIGAMTGPIHGMGIRKRMSQSVRDNGQSRKTLSHI